MKILLAILIAIFASNVQAQPVAQTPPMGWDSYNCFGSVVHEDEVKANADYLAKPLKQYGWQYIVVDFLWAYDNPPGICPFQFKRRTGNDFFSF
jgi:alpha-galactosidase